MAHSNGHIYAPVSIEDVSEVLGVNSTDVGTLCMSERINPYSLIRPFSMPISSPTTLVSELKDYHDSATLPSDGNVMWEARQWGYQVPYVAAPGRVDQVRERPWYRSTLKATDWKNLSHFDGYLHNARPSFSWNASVIAGQPISVFFFFGAPQNNMLSADGKGNNGGVVSILEVFGDAPFYFGVTIQRGTTSNYFFANEPINPSSTQTTGMIDTGMNAENGVTYTITPWIANKPRSGNNLPTDFRCYGLKFAEEYESYMVITTESEHVSLALSISNGTMRIIADNTFDAPYLVSGLTMHIQYVRRSDYTGSDITNPPIIEETRSINESIYVNAKDSATLTITGSRVEFPHLSATYPTARVWLTGRAGNQSGTGYWEETMSNMVIVNY